VYFIEWVLIVRFVNGMLQVSHVLCDLNCSQVIWVASPPPSPPSSKKKWEFVLGLSWVQLGLWLTVTSFGTPFGVNGPLEGLRAGLFVSLTAYTSFYSPPKWWSEFHQSFWVVCMVNTRLLHHVGCFSGQSSRHLKLELRCVGS
jgi:hypothetical protein